MTAQLNVFRIIGSSNIRNAFSTRLKLSERITGQTTEFVSAVAYSSGLLALSDLKGVSTVLVSFLENGLADATELCTDFGEVDKVMDGKVREYLAAVLMAASINSSAKFYVMPPLTRLNPIWLEAKLAPLTDVMCEQTKNVENITLLPPFIALANDFESDGVHLNRQTQSRLFNHILDVLFPGERSVKTKNISRSLSITDDYSESPPGKKINDEVGIPSSTPTNSSPGTSSQAVPESVDVSISLSDDGEIGQQTQTQSTPATNIIVQVNEDVNMVALSNPDLQQLYDMLSKKMDSIRDGSIVTQHKVQAVEARVSATVQQVERNTLMIRSLHLRTARQAEILDAHSNSLNLNVVMISGVPETQFPVSEELPEIKEVIKKLITYTPFLVSGVKFATYAKYIKHQQGKLPNIKAFFINSDTALAFREKANKLRIEKKEFWSSVYVSNDPTKSTRVRIAILQAIAKRLAPLPANSGKTIFVSRYDVKPQLCFKFGGRVEKRYGFVDAIEKYRSILQPDDKAAARKVAGKTFTEDELRQFIVL